MVEQNSERTVIKIPLQESKMLEITNKSVLIYSGDKVQLTVPIHNVRSIVPSKESSISIHYTKADIEPSKLNYETKSYKLDNHQLTPSKLCNKILRDLSKQKIIPENKEGLFYLRPKEYIEHTCPNVGTGRFRGLLYVTNFGLVHELDGGIFVDILYDQIVSIEKYKNTITIEWGHLLPADDNVFSFDLVFPKEIDLDSLYWSIKKQFANPFTKFDFDYSMGDDHYLNLDLKKMYKLAQRQEPDFYRWIESCSKFIFGPFAPEFTDVEDNLILACKVNDWTLT